MPTLSLPGAVGYVNADSAACDEAFATHDLLLMPTTIMKAHRIPPPDAAPPQIIGSAFDMLGNTMPFDGTGHPSMSVPAGLSEGLPVGMMFSGRYGEDDVVLRAGHAVQQVVRLD